MKYSQKQLVSLMADYEPIHDEPAFSSTLCPPRTSKTLRKKLRELI
jgi:hypothetical protein